MEGKGRLENHAKGSGSPGPSAYWTPEAALPAAALRAGVLAPGIEAINRLLCSTAQDKYSYLILVLGYEFLDNNSLKFIIVLNLIG